MKSKSPYPSSKAASSPYPISAAFKKDVERSLKDDGVKEIGRSMGRMLKEYEHGTAKVGDLAPGLNLHNTAAVLMEGLLYLDGERMT